MQFEFIFVALSPKHTTEFNLPVKSFESLISSSVHYGLSLKVTGHFIIF